MTTDYNPIAAQYKAAKQQPWRRHVEKFTLLELLGDPTGKAVLDLACGEGFLTRLIKQRGASRVVGVDLSEKMIDLARQEEALRPLGIEYVVQDAREFDPGAERFDLVTAGYLLNYASTREELLAMCRVISRSLKPGGRFVTVNNDPNQPREYFEASRKYGLFKVCDGELIEGAAITHRFFLDDGVMELINYQLSVATHEWAFRQAGLREVQWHKPRLSPEGLPRMVPRTWADFLNHSPITFIDCVKR